MLARLRRSWLQGVLSLNARLKSAAVQLTRLAGRSPVAIHPKHLLETDAEHHWYLQHVSAGMMLLDVGCGLGMPAVRVAGRAHVVVALDRCLPVLHTACQLRERHAATNLALLAADAEHPLPFRSGSLDAVMLLDVIEHLNGRTACLAEIHRLLHEDELLLVSAPNWDTSWKRRLRSAGLPAYADADHKLEYTQEELAEELESAGFRPEGEFSPIVFDTPWTGAIDLIGAVSGRLYKAFSRRRRLLAGRFPHESTGWQVRCRKAPEPCP